MLKNVDLVKGKCALCRGPIDKQWAGESPPLGTKCRLCSNKGEVFGPDHVEIHVEKELVFDPLSERYEYHFTWKGSKIMVNGRVGVITLPQGDGDFVQLEGEENQLLGSFINGVGYWDLLRIYRAQGGETEPPPLTFPPYVPKIVDLLAEPILPVVIEDDEKTRMIRSAWIPEHDDVLRYKGRGSQPSLFQMLHAFTNAYVRFKFGLAPNFAFEGGFIGRNFEVRNFLASPGVVVVGTGSFGESFDRVRSQEDFMRYDAIQNLLGTIYQKEQARPGVLYLDADVNTVLTVWAFVMRTLLRYNWQAESYETVFDIWSCYCRMQDVLLNIMPPEELQLVLAYA